MSGLNNENYSLDPTKYQADMSIYQSAELRLIQAVDTSLEKALTPNFDAILNRGGIEDLITVIKEMEAAGKPWDSALEKAIVGNPRVLEMVLTKRTWSTFLNGITAHNTYLKKIDSICLRLQIQYIQSMYEAVYVAHIYRTESRDGKITPENAREKKVQWYKDARIEPGTFGENHIIQFQQIVRSDDTGEASKQLQSYFDLKSRFTPENGESLAPAGKKIASAEIVEDVISGKITQKAALSQTADYFQYLGLFESQGGQEASRLFLQVQQNPKAIAYIMMHWKKGSDLYNELERRGLSKMNDDIMGLRSCIMDKYFISEWKLVSYQENPEELIAFLSKQNAIEGPKVILENEIGKLNEDEGNILIEKYENFKEIVSAIRKELYTPKEWLARLEWAKKLIDESIKKLDGAYKKYSEQVAIVGGTSQYQQLKNLYDSAKGMQEPLSLIIKDTSRGKFLDIDKKISGIDNSFLKKVQWEDFVVSIDSKNTGLKQEITGQNYLQKYIINKESRDTILSASADSDELRMFLKYIYQMRRSFGGEITAKSLLNEWNPDHKKPSPALQALSDISSSDAFFDRLESIPDASIVAISEFRASVIDAKRYELEWAKSPTQRIKERLKASDVFSTFEESDISEISEILGSDKSDSKRFGKIQGILIENLKGKRDVSSAEKLLKEMYESIVILNTSDIRENENLRIHKNQPLATVDGYRVLWRFKEKQWWEEGFLSDFQSTNSIGRMLIESSEAAGASTPTKIEQFMSIIDLYLAENKKDAPGYSDVVALKKAIVQLWGSEARKIKWKAVYTVFTNVGRETSDRCLPHLPTQWSPLAIGAFESAHRNAEKETVVESIVAMSPELMKKPQNTEVIIAALKNNPNFMEVLTDAKNESDRAKFLSEHREYRGLSAEIMMGSSAPGAQEGDYLSANDQLREMLADAEKKVAASSSEDDSWTSTDSKKSASSRDSDMAAEMGLSDFTGGRESSSSSSLSQESIRSIPVGIPVRISSECGIIQNDKGMFQIFDPKHREKPLIEGISRAEVSAYVTVVGMFDTIGAECLVPGLRTIFSQMKMQNLLSTTDGGISGSEQKELLRYISRFLGLEQVFASAIENPDSTLWIKQAWTINGQWGESIIRSRMIQVGLYDGATNELKEHAFKKAIDGMEGTKNKKPVWQKEDRSPDKLLQWLQFA